MSSPAEVAHGPAEALHVASLVLGQAAERVGRYRLGTMLGAGATATVFEGVDVDLGRAVAVKLLREGVSRQRLIREAQALALLRHPNVASFYEIGEDSGRLFIVMELIHGSSLRQVLERSQLSRADILDMFVQAGRGLKAAHDAGLVHRDFKPANVLVAEDGRVCVVDFGLAKPDDEPEGNTLMQGPSADDAATMTATGTVLGTPYFMAPEQYLGQKSDAKSDQYAFCVSLWLALYHQHPMNAAAASERYQIDTWRSLADPPAGVPRWLHRVLLRGIHPEPAQRWPDMGSLLDHLTRSPRRRWLKRIAIGVAVAGVASFVVALVMLLRASSLRERASRDDEHRALLRAKESADHASDQAYALAARLSPDDPTTAYLLMREIKHPEDTLGWFSAAVSIWHKPLSRAIFRGHTDRVRNISFSPDGKMVATASFDGTARLWRKDGEGSPTVLGGHDDHVYFANFSPDNRLLVTSSRDGTAMVWDVEDLDAPARLEGHESIVWWAGFSPDGRWIVTASKDKTARLWDADSANLWSTPPPPALAIFSGHEDQVWWGDFHPESTHVVTASKDKTARIWSVLEPEGEPLVLRGHTENLLRARFSPDGTQVVTAGVEANVRLWSVERDAVHVLRTSAARADDAVFSKDSKRLLTAKGLHSRPEVWDTANGRLLAQLKGGTGLSEVGVFGGDAEWIAVAEADGCIRVWADMDSETPIGLCGLGQGAVAIDASPDDISLVAGTNGGEARVWDVPEMFSAHMSRSDGAMAGAVSGDYLIASNLDITELEVFDVDGAAQRIRATTERFADCGMRHPTRNLLLTGTASGDVTLWDLSSGATLWSQFAGEGSRVLFAGEHHVVTASTSAGTWRLLDLASGQPVNTPRSSPGLFDMVVDMEGKHLVVVGSDGLVRRWNLHGDPEPIETFRIEAASTPLLIASPRGLALAAAGVHARVFGLHSGEILMTLQSSGGTITGATFSHSGQLVAFSTLLGKVEVWDIVRHQKIDSFSFEALGSNSLSFARDERWLAVAGIAAGQILVRDVSRSQWLGGIDILKTPIAIAFVGEEDDLWVQGRDEGVYRLRFGAILKGGADGLLNRPGIPGRETSVCLTAQQRTSLIGQPPLEARLQAMACELSHGRVDQILPSAGDWADAIADSPRIKGAAHIIMFGLTGRPQYREPSYELAARRQRHVQDVLLRTVQTD